MSSNNQIATVRKTKDADLVFLVKIVNKTHASIGLTLFFNGLIITGQLISGKTYYEHVSDRMKEVGDAGIALSGYFSDSAENVYSPTEKEDAPTNFMHLKDVKVRSDSGGINALNEAFLRMKVEEVSGHIIGTMS